jgi:sec-independent protein translocase protein TatA
MPSIGPMELIIVLVVALLVLGPKRLPDAGRSLGKGMREFRDSITGPRRTEGGAAGRRARGGTQVLENAGQSAGRRKSGAGFTGAAAGLCQRAGGLLEKVLFDQVVEEEQLD